MSFNNKMKVRGFDSHWDDCDFLLS